MGVPYFRAHNLVNNIQQRLSARVPIYVKHDLSQFPAAITQDAAAAGLESTSVNGAYFRNAVYINLSAIKTEKQLEVCIFHELYGHYGLHQLFGTETRQALQKLYQAIGGDEGFNKLTQKYGIKLDRYLKKLAKEPKETRESILAEELLAHIAQSSQPSIARAVKEVCGSIKSWWREHGFSQLGHVDDAEIAHLLKQARKAVERSVKHQIDENNFHLFSLSNTDTDTHITRTINGSDPILAAWTMLSQHDEIFQLPVSRKNTLEDIFSDLSGAKNRDHDFIVYEAEELAWQNDQEPDKAWRIETANGRVSAIYEKGESVWIDVSDLEQGEDGRRIYNVVANYAYNTGKIFIGDPSGLSDVAMSRRLENMIASALKFGTTRHLWPHERQQTGGAGLKPLDWIDSNDMYNLRQMINTSYDYVLRQFPEISDLVYNPDTDQFEDLTNGHALTPADFETLAANRRSARENTTRGRRDQPGPLLGEGNGGSEARAAAIAGSEDGVGSFQRSRVEPVDRSGTGGPITAGRSTLERAVFTQSILRGTSEEQSRLLAALGRQQSVRLTGILYSLSEDTQDIAQNREVDSTSQTFYQSAYHGTQHRFDRFKLNHIGTGEGFQSFGWGLYFSSHREVGSFYREKLSDPFSSKKQLFIQSMSTVPDEVASKIVHLILYDQKSPESAVKVASWNLGKHRRFIEDNREKLIEVATAARDQPVGTLFQVDIPENDQLLDWDKPLWEQPNGIKDKLQYITDFLLTRPLTDSYKRSIETGEITGEQIYWTLAGELSLVHNINVITDAPRLASEALMLEGIPGIRYLDGSSRIEGEGSYNYVIWDEKVISIEAVNDRLVNQTYYQFAGPTALTANQVALQAAQQFEQEGHDPEAIRQKTGWFRGEDNRWRFEISDHLAELKLRNLRPLGGPQYGFAGKLGDILQHDRLFAAYPFLHRLDISLEIIPGQGRAGYYNPPQLLENGHCPGSIVIEAGSVGDALSSLMHECQHAIQEAENFAVGGNEFTLKDIYVQTLKNRDRQLQGRFMELSQKYWRGVPMTDSEEQEYKVLTVTRNDIQAALESATTGKWNSAFYDRYQDLAGEREARITQQSIHLNDNERLARDPIVDERRDPIIQFRGTPIAIVASQMDLKPRANIEILPKKSIIRLSQSADKSSFFHEAAHLFLDMEARFSKGRPLTKTQVALLDWLDAPSFSALTHEHHEKFALGFEQYLHEGKSPNQSLAGIFDRVKQWLRNIYTSIADLGSPLTDQAREVFDSLLTTTQQPSDRDIKTAQYAERKYAKELEASGNYDREDAQACAQILSAYALAKAEREPETPTVGAVFDRMNLTIKAVERIETNLARKVFDFHTFSLKDLVSDTTHITPAGTVDFSQYDMNDVANSFTRNIQENRTPTLALSS